MAELKRTLSLAEVVFFASGVILGAGIYAVIGKAAGAAGNMLWLSFIVASITAVLSLFSYAELCSIYPSSGGEYTYVKKSVGPHWANVVGIMVTLSGMVSAATISLAFAGYLGQLTGLAGQVAAPAIIILLLGLNISGIRQSSSVNIVFTIVETLGLLYVIIAAAPSFGEVDYLERPPSGLTGLFTGAAICFFAFTGFEDAVKLAEETKQPEKNIPRALFISAVIIGVLYLTVAVLAVSAVSYEELNASESPLSLILEKRFGHTGAIIISVVALFSTANSLLSNMLGASRVLYTFGKNTPRLKLLGKVLPKRRTPYIALLIAATVIVAFSLIGQVRVVALITNFFMFVTFLIMNCVVIYLRFKQPDIERPFRIPLSIRKVPLPAVLGILCVLLLMVFAVIGLISGEGLEGTQ